MLIIVYRGVLLRPDKDLKKIYLKNKWPDCIKKSYPKSWANVWKTP